VRRFLRRLRRRTAAGPAPLILMYHRIAETHLDPWGLAVSPACFAAQVDLLKASRRILPLREFAAMHAAGRPSADALAITFDDGYACNAAVAAPILARHDAPATFFLTTGHIGSDREFWWDELARLFFEGPSAGDFTLRAGEETISFAIGPADDKDGSFDASQPPRSLRQAGYLKVWQALRDCGMEERTEAIDRLWRDARGISPPRARASHRTMTADEIRGLAQSGLAEIGAHTVRHPALGTIDPAVQKREIDDSKAACEALIGQPPRSFAYPHGSYTKETVAYVRAAGFELACATEEKIVQPKDDLLELPRLQVRDWDAAGLMEAIRKLETAPGR
jgi:peptidoglycan/xylan/chitin deacetylase (PgdA/CDA1 family)